MIMVNSMAMFTVHKIVAMFISLWLPLILCTVHTNAMEFLEKSTLYCLSAKIRYHFASRAIIDLYIFGYNFYFTKDVTNANKACALAAR